MHSSHIIFFSSFIIFLTQFPLTLQSILVNITNNNKTFPVIESKQNQTKTRSFYNISTILSLPSCVCNYEQKTYISYSSRNSSSFIIYSNSSMNDSLTLSNTHLYSSNQKYPSYYSLNKHNSSFYNLSIYTDCTNKGISDNYNTYIQGEQYENNIYNNEGFTFINFSFINNVDQNMYSFSFVKICENNSASFSYIMYFIMFILGFSYLFLGTYFQLDLKEIKEMNEIGEIPWYYGIIFTIIGSIVLLLIFYFVEYVEIIFAVLIFFQSLLCMFYTIKYLLKVFMKKRKETICYDLKIYDIISLSLSLIIVAIYFYTKHWYMNNIIAFGLIFSILSIILIKNFKTCFVLLFCIFIYDTFWVFYSDRIFEGSVMEKAATSLILPIKIEMFDVFTSNPFKSCSLLGLGDIVLPGFVVKYCRRFDHLKGKKGYFKLGLILYAISVFSAGLMVIVYEHGQPVMFYISPLFIIGLVLKSLWNGEFKEFWNGLEKKETNEKEKGTEGKEMENKEQEDTKENNNNEQNGYKAVSNTEK